MNSSDFNLQINRLSSRWKNVYSDDVVQIIWRVVESLPSVWFKNSCDEWIGSARQAPLLSEIRESANGFREWQSKKNRSEEVPFSNVVVNCDYCFDNGVYLANKLPSKEIWAFRCHCERGLADQRTSIPHFTQESADQGFIWSGKR